MNVYCISFNQVISTLYKEKDNALSSRQHKREGPLLRLLMSCQTDGVISDSPVKTFVDIDINFIIWLNDYITWKSLL